MTNYDPTSPPEAEQARWPGLRRLLSKKMTRILAAVVVCAVIGVSVALATSPSTTSAQPGPGTGAAGGPASGGGGSNARSGPAAGGASGTVGSVSTSSFTITTSAGQKVTVDEASATTYQKGTSPASARAITTGESVLVVGTVNSTSITATQVTVQPTG